MEHKPITKAELLALPGFLESQALTLDAPQGAVRETVRYILQDGIPIPVPISLDTLDGVTTMKVSGRVKILLHKHDPSFVFTVKPITQEYKIQGFGKRQARIVPAPARVAEAANAIIRTRMAFTNFLVNDAVHVKYTLAILGMLPEFVEYYDLYVADPDEGVEFNSVNIFDPAAIAGADQYTDHEAYIICGLIILSLNKNWVSDAHFNTFILTRAKAMRSMLTAEGVSLERLSELLKFATVKGIASTMQFYPKLKSVIFTYVLHHQSAITAHLRTLLEMSQMAVYNLIRTFMAASIKSALHTHPPVTSQMLIFLAAEKKLVAMFGNAGVPFAKLIDPTTTLTQISSFRLLAEAAWTFALVNLDSTKTLRRLRGRAKPNRLFFKLAAKHIKHEFMDNPPVEALNEELRRALGLKNTFIATNADHYSFAEDAFESSWETIMKEEKDK